VTFKSLPDTKSSVLLQENRSQPGNQADLVDSAADFFRLALPEKRGHPKIIPLDRISYGYPLLPLPLGADQAKPIFRAGLKKYKEVFMKILGIMGSPRIGGNSDLLLDQALAGAREAGGEVEKIILVQKKISGCYDCKKCNDSGICAVKDEMPEIHQKILEAQAIIHSVPVYFWSMTSQMKAYLDRWCALFDANWRWHQAYLPKMKGKGMGLITVCGDPDVHTADPIVHSFKNTADFTKMKWIGAVMASATEKGEIAQNETALKEAFDLGRLAVTT
jgi:multimeric flavodoxin WrbA